MTLVVSELSRHGIVMVGDSAVTYSDLPNRDRAKAGAAKIHYASAANIGFGVWGNALICNQQLDQWLSEFILNNISENSRLEDVGEQLAENLRYGFRFDGRSWGQLKCGIHLAGYFNGLPRLWHVHMGHADEEPHEPRLYKDFPEGKGWADDYIHALFSEGGTLSFHLRGGYIPHYALLFDQTTEYSNKLRTAIGISFPADSLHGHLEFQKVLVRFVAGVLIASGAHQGVNSDLSAVAFDKDGIEIDERLPITNWYTDDGEHAMRNIGFGLIPRIRPDGNDFGRLPGIRTIRRPWAQICSEHQKTHSNQPQTAFWEISPDKSPSRQLGENADPRIYSAAEAWTA